MDFSDLPRDMTAAIRIRSPERSAWLFIGLVCTSIVFLVAWRVLLARDRALQEGQAATTSLVRTLADQAHTTIQVADMVVSGLGERLEAGGTSDAMLARVSRVATMRVQASHLLRTVSVEAADGRTIAGTVPADRVDEDATDRSYFAYHATHDDHLTRVGPPSRGRSGDWSITVSRRFDQPGGGFGGVVLATIDLATFGSVYSSFDIGRRGSITLLHDDGTVLMRVPPAPDLIGRSVAESPMYRHYRASAGAGALDGPAAFDQRPVYESFRKVEDYPLVVSVARARSDILASWRAETATGLACAGVVAMLLGALGWRLTEQIRLRHRADVAVRSSERQFRLLADHSTDLIVLLDAEHRALYASPASLAVLGLAPDAVVGCSVLGLMHPEDREALAKTLADIAVDGTAPPVSCRVQRQGSELWVEAQGRRLEREPGIVLAFRDITERKQAEAALHQANNQLQRMVMLDGMTGIANRRCFDLVLAKEFRRNVRHEAPLALLLIDVDHFKRFNDRYGHLAGDACLKQVAEAVGLQMRRPGDLAARYGGEEFAAILPDTDERGALVQAERIQTAIRALRIEHGSVPGRVVSISIGVAVVWPRGDQEAALADLMQRADRAMYRAKATGRDRICLDTAPLEEESARLLLSAESPSQAETVTL